jgi:tetratricopeptide (TPR) repeat protein
MQKTIQLLFFFAPMLCLAQTQRLDSLKAVVATAKEDSSKVNLLMQLSKEYMTTSPAEAARYGLQARDLARNLKFKSGEAFALKNMGVVYYNQARYVETVDYWNQSYRLFDSLGDQTNGASLLNNIGSVYMNQGDDVKALEYYFKSLHITEQSGEKRNTAVALANIGTIYSNNQFTHDKALTYYQKALTLSEALNDKTVTGGVLVNIGEIYLNEDKDDSALYYFKRSLDAYAGTENIPYSLNDIGKTYTKKGDYKLARQYHEQAITFATKLDLQLDIVQSYLGLGHAHYMEGSINGLQ